MNDTRPPFEIPGYRIVRRLGSGGMAVVLLGIQESLARPVAIKVLQSAGLASEETERRFEHEVRTIARLNHPHIVSIFDVGRTSAGRIYYTMPYLANGDLSTRSLRDDQAGVLAIVRALAEALGYAHDQGIVHRDVKPENILFDERDRPLLADFGIALNTASHPRVTRDGATVGSSGYMSPEQARGRSLDGRSDLYSLGVVCYELLTGEMPYQGQDSLAMALAHVEKPIPRLPLTRRAWQPLLDKALAKQPEARFQSAEEMLATLAVLEKRLQAQPRNGIRGFGMRSAERFLAIPRRTRALALGASILLAFAGVLALLPQVPPRAAAPHADADHAPAANPANAAAENVVATEPAPGNADAAAEAAPAADPAADATAEAAEATDAKRAIEDRLRDAAALLARGRLTLPPNDSAAQRYLSILRDAPRQPDAVKGIERILALLAARAAKAIDGGDAATAQSAMEQGFALGEQAHGDGSRGFEAFAKPVADAVEKRRARVGNPFDTAALRGLEPLLPTLARLDTKLAHALQADLARPATLLASGGAFRDAGGPELVVVPTVLAQSGHVERAFAVSAGAVTRGAWERFAADSGRPPSPCRESQRLFARSDGLDWRRPGFVQGDDHPVVCVSWDDANAYARWLSARTGATYRLPTADEWRLLAQPAGRGTACPAANLGRRSGGNRGCDDGYAQTAPVGRFPPTPPGLYDIVGNVSEWIGGCADAKPAPQCRQRAFRGLSWRDDDGESNLERRDTAAPDVGYPTVGFRLVRELPPPATDAR